MSKVAAEREKQVISIYFDDVDALVLSEFLKEAVKRAMGFSQ